MKIIENDSIKYWIEDEILFSEFKKPTNITLKNTKEFIALRHQISNNEKQYLCFDIKKAKSFPKEAREYVNIHGQDFLYARAVIVHSHIQMFMLNSLLKISTPIIPLKGFNKKEKAVKWLKELKQKNGMK